MIPTCHVHKFPQKWCDGCKRELAFLLPLVPIDCNTALVFRMRRDRSIVSPEDARAVADTVNRAYIEARAKKAIQRVVGRVR